MEKSYNLEQQKVKQLEDDIIQLNISHQNSKSNYIKMLLEKDKEIEQLRKSKSKLPQEPDVNEQFSKTLVQPQSSLLNSEPGLINDSFSTDYIRNIFGKYLIYMAKKKEKRAKTCENILFTLLNLTQEQIGQINKARKKNSFWEFFKNIRGATKSGLDMGELDMNFNFSMTDAGESFSNFDNFGGIPLDSLNNYQIDLMQESNKNEKISKKKKIKKDNKLQLNSERSQECSTQPH